MTGATGGIGSKVARKLLKAGNLHINVNFKIGAKIVMLVQDQSKVDYALQLRDPKIKSGREYFPINMNLKEPY